jgi:Flp pilus assembly protein TadD
MNAEAVKPFNDGLAKSNQGNYKDALADFQKALNYDKDYRIYYQLGFAQMKLNDLDNAVSNFNNSIKANPGFDAAYNDLGNVYYSQGKFRDAINNFEKVLGISKDKGIKTAVKYNLALSYTELATEQEKNKDYKNAVSLLNKAVQYNNYDEAYFLLARNYVEDNQYDNAIKSSEKALKYRKDIKESGPDYYLGVAYSQKGEMAKAKEYLNKAEKDPVYKSSAEEILKAINK